MLLGILVIKRDRFSFKGVTTLSSIVRTLLVDEFDHMRQNQQWINVLNSVRVQTNVLIKVTLSKVNQMCGVDHSSPVAVVKDV